MIRQDTDNHQELKSDSTKSTFISNSQAGYSLNTGLEAAGVLGMLTHKATFGRLGKIKIRTEVICCTRFKLAFSHRCTNSYKWKTFKLAKEDAMDFRPAGEVEGSLGFQLGTLPDNISYSSLRAKKCPQRKGCFYEN